LFVPLTDQLEEHAKRKIAEREITVAMEKEKDSIWSEAKRNLADPEEETKRFERH
jgi:hypothetical protein